MRRVLAACAIVCICIAPALAGPKEGKDACTCKEIKKAGEGWCSHCKDGMVCRVDVKDEKVYKAMKESHYAQAVEKGEMVKASEIKCADCKKLAEAHKDGWCKKCNAGMVCGYLYKDKAGYDKAEHAAKVCREASKTKCEGCAIAMLTDAKCDQCKVSYKDGKKTKG